MVHDVVRDVVRDETRKRSGCNEQATFGEAGWMGEMD